uniref:Uncharacterized protein n=1 Tax=Panagrolaimus davidi TaxID=227884 RepID=A0A914R9E6_9BILA
MIFLQFSTFIVIFLIVLTEQSPANHRNTSYRLCGDDGSTFIAHDSLFPEDPVELIVKHIPEVPISPKYIAKTCTPTCVAPECTRECKCAYTHQEVYATCSPPANSDIATVCQAWYRRCPVFKALGY